MTVVMTQHCVRGATSTPYEQIGDHKLHLPTFLPLHFQAFERALTHVARTGDHILLEDVVRLMLGGPANQFAPLSR